MRLQVLTLNCWGVPVWSQQRAARMRAIGRALAEMELDVVGLQEVFFGKDRQVIARAAAEGGLVHTHYFSSGVMGSGLFTLSRYPITETSFTRFRLNGRPQELIRGDYYAGKGIGRARLTTPAGPVDVYNAHLVAPYLEFGPDRFLEHRLTQVLEAAQNIRTASADVPSILTCDLNSTPDSVAYRALAEMAGLIDTCPAAKLDGSDFWSADENPQSRRHTAKHVDYVFARSAAGGQLAVTSSSVVLTGAPEPNPERIRAYSDHYGIRSELELLPAPAAATQIPAGNPALAASIAQTLDHGIRRGHATQRSARIFAATASVISAALLAPRGQARGGRGLTRVLAGATLAALLITGGINLSTVAHVNGEVDTLRTMLTEYR
jgi:sphingomyelin phosphodiesterase 2